MVNKVGVDDYFAAGGTVQQLLIRAVPWKSGVKQITEERSDKLPYQSKDGHLVHTRRTPQGTTETVLCNFDARILEERIKDNGLEVSNTLLLKGFLEDKTELDEIEVDKGKFEGMSWVGRWPHAIHYAGQSTKDHIRVAIHMLSGKYPVRKVFTHTGWREVQGKRCFLTASGGLGLEGVQVDLKDPSFSNYKLPLAPENVPAAMEASLRFLDASDHSVTMPLWGAVHLAPLCEELKPTFLIWLEGFSGSFKSTIAALALSHFGDFPGSVALPLNWRSTVNDIERGLAILKDVPVVIDDLHPGVDPKETHRLAAAAAGIVRLIGDYQARGRLKSDATRGLIYRPRCLPIVTGEELLTGYSTSGRVFSVHIEKRMTDLGVLSQRQAEAHMYPHEMAGYLLWLRDRWGQVSELRKQWVALRARAGQENGGHSRFPEQIAWLQLGFEAGTGFAESLGVLTAAKRKQLNAEAFEMLQSTSRKQAADTNAERPGLLFLDVLKQLIFQERVTLANKDALVASPPNPHAPLIGWRDNEYCYLHPQASYSQVCEATKRTGGSFIPQLRSVLDDLKRMGVTESPASRTTSVLWIMGRNRSVLKLAIAALGLDFEENRSA